MDYAFYLRTTRSPAAVRDLIERATRHAAWRSLQGEPREPVWVTAAIPSTREMIAEVYGFEPDVVVSVQLDKFADDIRERDAQALDALRVLLQEDRGDLYADLLDGIPVLLRKSGRIEVDQRWLQHRPWATELLPASDCVALLARI